MNNLVGKFIYWMNHALAEQKGVKDRRKKCGYSNPDSTMIPDEIMEIRDLFLPRKTSPTLPV